MALTKRGMRRTASQAANEGYQYRKNRQDLYLDIMSLLGRQVLFTKLVAIIDSMTNKERFEPKIINGSRKKRIASGSGTKIQDINKLLKQFNHMQKMMKKFSNKGGLTKILKGVGGSKTAGFPF